MIFEWLHVDSTVKQYSLPFSNPCLKTKPRYLNAHAPPISVRSLVFWYLNICTQVFFFFFFPKFYLGCLLETGTYPDNPAFPRWACRLAFRFPGLSYKRMYWNKYNTHFHVIAIIHWVAKVTGTMQTTRISIDRAGELLILKNMHYSTSCSQCLPIQLFFFKRISVILPISWEAYLIRWSSIKRTDLFWKKLPLYYFSIDIHHKLWILFCSLLVSHKISVAVNAERLKKLWIRQNSYFIGVFILDK